MQKLFAILVALAVLVAPAFTRGGEAAAAAPDHHAQMMKSGHCEMPASKSGDHGNSADKSCCASACMGVAVAAPVVAVLHESLPAMPAATAVLTFQLGPPPEIATPPPRLA